jgi:hypothetical protein
MKQNKSLRKHYWSKTKICKIVKKVLTKEEKLVLRNKSLKTMLLNSVSVINPKQDYTHLISNFLEIFFHWEKNEGMVSAVKRLKSNHQALLNFVNNSVIETPFIRRTREGFPKALMLFYRLCKSRKIIDLNIVNTLCRFHRNFLGDGINVKLQSITDKSPTPYNLVLAEEIRQKTRQLVSGGILNKINISKLKPEFFISGKAGPSGPAVLSAQGCLSAMKNGNNNDQRLLTHIRELAKVLDFNNVEETLKVTKDEISTGEFHSKIKIKRDKSCKNRPFATVDYLTQVLLKPLNTELFRTLENFGDSDATFNQNKIIPFVELHCKKTNLDSRRIFSIDLSKATDRLKRGYYQVILDELTGDPKFAQLVILCMTDREFIYDGHKYKYEEGQGMGTYCSWPLMALLHHIIVQLAAEKAGLTKYKGKSWIYPWYILLGDDLSLVGSDLYREYLSIMNIIEEGIVNRTKCIINRKGSANMVEFASRYFLQGREITGVSTNLLKDLSRVSPDGPFVPLINLARDIANKLSFVSGERCFTTIINALPRINKIYGEAIRKYPVFFTTLLPTPPIKGLRQKARKDFSKLMNLIIVAKMYRTLNDNLAESSRKIWKVVFQTSKEDDVYGCPRDEDGELLDTSLLGMAFADYQNGKTCKVQSWLDRQFIVNELGNPSSGPIDNVSNLASKLIETFDPMGSYSSLNNYVSLNLSRKESIKLYNNHLRMLKITLSQFQKAMRLWKLSSFRSRIIIISGFNEQMLVNILQFPPMEESKDISLKEKSPLLTMATAVDLKIGDIKSLDSILPSIYHPLIKGERKTGWLETLETEFLKPPVKGESPYDILLDLEYPQCGYEMGVVKRKTARKEQKRSDLLKDLSTLSKKEREALIASISAISSI